MGGDRRSSDVRRMLEDKIDRPFSKDVAAKAARIAMQYKIVLERDEGGWIGHGLELPNVYGDGKKVADCVASVREAMTAAVATMLEAGQVPPAPAREGRRSRQVNVRLTPEEKLVLESRARQKGFRGLSDFIRAEVLAFSK